MLQSLQLTATKLKFLTISCCPDSVASFPPDNNKQTQDQKQKGDDSYRDINNSFVPNPGAASENCKRDTSIRRNRTGNFFYAENVACK